MLRRRYLGRISDAGDLQTDELSTHASHRRYACDHFAHQSYRSRYPKRSPREQTNPDWRRNRANRLCKHPDKPARYTSWTGHHALRKPAKRHRCFPRWQALRRPLSRQCQRLHLSRRSAGESQYRHRTARYRLDARWQAHPRRAVRWENRRH